MNQLGVSVTSAHLDSILAKQNAVDKKIIEIKKQIEIQEGAHRQSMSSIESNKGYAYFLSEKQRVEQKTEQLLTFYDSNIDAFEAKRESLIQDIERKIEALEAKKKIINDDIDRKIELERKNKKNSEDKLSLEQKRNEEKLETIRTRHEEGCPTSLSYRKLQESLVIAEREKKDLDAEWRLGVEQNNIAIHRQMERAKRDMEAEQRKRTLEEEAKQAEERQKIEAMREQQRQEDIQKARKRSLEARMARNAMAITTIEETLDDETTTPPPPSPPPQGGGTPPSNVVEAVRRRQIDFPLNIKEKYSIKQLDELQDRYIEKEEDFPKEEVVVFNRCWAYACRREGKLDWEENIYNHVDENKDLDVMTEAEFLKLFR
jgi:hypothetical protein